MILWLNNLTLDMELIDWSYAISSFHTLSQGQRLQKTLIWFFLHEWDLFLVAGKEFALGLGWQSIDMLTKLLKEVIVYLLEHMVGFLDLFVDWKLL